MVLLQYDFTTATETSSFWKLKLQRQYDKNEYLVNKQCYRNICNQQLLTLLLIEACEFVIESTSFFLSSTCDFPWKFCRTLSNEFGTLPYSDRKQHWWSVKAKTKKHQIIKNQPRKTNHFRCCILKELFDRFVIVKCVIKFC